MPYGFQQVNRVPCKSADGLGKNDVYFSFLAVNQHSLEFITLDRVCA